MPADSPHPAAPTDAEARPALGEFVDSICRSYHTEPRMEHIDATFLPSREEVISLLGLVRRLIFPGFFRETRLTSENIRAETERLVAQARSAMEHQIDHALRYAANLERQGHGDQCAQCTRRARQLTDRFLRFVPELRRMLAMDVQAAFEGDPACRNTDEAIFCYPGVLAIVIHRAAHALFEMGVPLLPRMMNEYAHACTGIDIHPGASIGESFFVDHGTGVVIGETAVIGNRVKIYQSVTIGAPAAHLSQAARGVKRHPTVEDDVVVYANATILGGNTIIGKGCVIGGGVFITSSIPPGHFVYNTAQELKYRSADRLREIAQAQQAEPS
ncbi:MAG: serine acetyltransferase [Alphaproteobacteria bacterium]|nr:serine acetyltransferase [Alphaproteobacteria bacterium]